MGTPDYVVEGGELIMAPNNNPPRTDNNGRVTQIGKNMFKFEGDTHDAPSGGIGVQGGNSEFASQTNQVLDSGFVFSDRLKANPDDYLKKYIIMAKMTYAQIAEKLNNQYNKYDRNLQNAVTDAEKNSAMLMLQRVSDKLNQLMLANQAEANAADQKETPPDSLIKALRKEQCEWLRMEVA